MPGPPPTAYLKGGPCNGTTRKLTGAELDSGTLTCKGSTYNHTNNLHGDDVIFKYEAIPAGSNAGGGPGAKAPRAHNGWADLQRSVNHHWPNSLKRSQRVTEAALRSLHHTHRVKG